MKSDKYYMYNHDDFNNWKKWWTTDKKVIEQFKQARKYNIIGTVFVLISILSVISILVFGGLQIVVGVILSLLLFLITVFTAVGFFNVYEQLWDKAECNYFKTKEYKKLKEKYDKEEKEKIDAIHREKATKLVEAYDIIDNKGLSKTERIELLKDYMKE